MIYTLDLIIIRQRIASNVGEITTTILMTLVSTSRLSCQRSTKFSSFHSIKHVVKYFHLPKRNNFQYVIVASNEREAEWKRNQIYNRFAIASVAKAFNCKARRAKNIKINLMNIRNCELQKQNYHGHEERQQNPSQRAKPTNIPNNKWIQSAGIEPSTLLAQTHTQTFIMVSHGVFHAENMISGKCCCWNYWFNSVTTK